MTNEHDNNDVQSTNSQIEEPVDQPEKTAGDEESSSGIRRRSVIAATLGSPAILGLGFGVADRLAIPGPSSATVGGAASPVERAQAGNSVLAQMDSVTSSVGEEPAQGLPMNQNHVLHASEEVLETLEREPGEQVRVTRDEDTAVFTLLEEMEEDLDDEEEPDDEDETVDETAAAVEFSNQETDGNSVAVDFTRVDDGGFVAIHDSSLLEGEVISSVIGVSEYLEPGEYDDLEVELDETLEDDDLLIAMPHEDTNDNEEYDFVTSEGEEDGPYFNQDDEPIIDDAQVTVLDDPDEDGNGVEDEDDEEDDDVEQPDGAIVRASREGKCRLAFYEETEFDDDRRWGPLRGDETCDLADQEFDVQIDPRVPAEDVDAEQAEEEGELVETFVEGDTDIAVIAPHGGQIQPFTDLQAELMLEEFPDITAWMLQGYGQNTGFYRWFVPSAEISEASYPGLAELSEESYDLAVSFNGITGENIYVGGTADEELRSEIVDAIEEALPHDGSPVMLGENQYAAESSQTLVNRITEGESNGIWIGQPIADRRNSWDLIVDAVGSVLGDEE